MILISRLRPSTIGTSEITTSFDSTAERSSSRLEQNELRSESFACQASRRSTKVMAISASSSTTSTSSPMATLRIHSRRSSGAAARGYVVHPSVNNSTIDRLKHKVRHCGGPPTYQSRRCGSAFHRAAGCQWVIGPCRSKQQSISGNRYGALRLNGGPKLHCAEKAQEHRHTAAGIITPRAGQARTRARQISRRIN